MKFTCPVCGFGLNEPPVDYNICPCCGTEFGYHDSGRTYDDIRREWIAAGARWWSPSDPIPDGWNPNVQLIRAGLTVEFKRATERSEKLIVSRAAAGVELVAP